MEKFKYAESNLKHMLKYIIPFLVIVLGMLLTEYMNPFLGYSIKVLLGLGAIVYFWKQYKEINIKFDGLAWLFGFLIIAIWIGLEFLNKGNTSGYDPTIYTGALFYLLIAVKIIGMVVVAAVIEEIFMRSFLIRIFISKNFEKIKIGTFTWISFILTTVLFGLLHGYTLTGSRLVVGLIAGAMFNLWLYYRKDIFSCIQCHAAANLGLVVYVLITQNYLLW